MIVPGLSAARIGMNHAGNILKSVINKGVKGLRVYSINQHPEKMIKKYANFGSLKMTFRFFTASNTGIDESGSTGFL